MTPALPPVVIVEDSDEDYETIQEALRRAGLAADLRRVTTGGDCLDLLRGGAGLRPALMLIDLNTPGTDGREALGVIKTDAELRNCPVVVFSTSANPKDVAFCYRAGANAYHVKPVRYTDHLRVVIDVLSYWLACVVLPEAGASTP